MWNPTRTVRTRFAALVVLTAAAGTTLAGCAEEAVPAEEQEAVNTGVNVDVGRVSADNLLIISTAEGEPGRLLGNLYVEADEPVTVTFADPDETITVVVDSAAVEYVPGDGYSFEEREHVFETTEDRPGGYAEIIVAAEEETETVEIPVYDGSLEYYEPFLPEEG